MGRGDGQGTGHPQGTHESGVVRGVQSGRQDAGLGELRTRRSSCGTWRRARNRPPSRDTRTPCWPWPISPDGKTLASGSADKTIKLWDVATGKERATLKGHTDWVNSVAFSPDGKTLASGSGDKTVKLWEVATGK